MTRVEIHLRSSLLALAATLGVGVLIAPASVSARRLESRPGAGCQTSLETPSTAVAAGDGVTLAGKLSCPEAASAEGVELTFYERQRGAGRGSAWSEVGSASTGEDGSFEFTSAPLEGNCVFLVRPAGGRSARAAVTVTPKVTLSGPALTTALFTRAGHAGADNRWTFSGTVNPAAVGTRVALQSEYTGADERWRTVAVAHVGSEGDFSIIHGFRSPGTLSVRVLVRIKGGEPVASEPLSLDVSQAENPSLTIVASSNPFATGQTLSITGVAAAGAGKSLTLLARSGGGRFAPVASMQSEEGGTYSFSVSPQQRTYYRVIEGLVRSTVLREEVADPAI